MNKYPRIKHIPGSKASYDDLVSPVFPTGEFLVFEKLDGANLGVSMRNGVLRLQNRGGYLENKRPHEQWDAAKNWAYNLYGNFLHALKDMPEDTVIFGEWLFAKHSIHYEFLPSFFVVFDVYSDGRFLEYEQAKTISEEAGLVFSPLICTTSDIETFLKIAYTPLYSKIHEGFIFRRKTQYNDVYKMVRREFSAGITTHWFNSRMVKNKLSFDSSTISGL